MGFLISPQPAQLSVTLQQTHLPASPSAYHPLSAPAPFSALFYIIRLLALKGQLLREALPGLTCCSMSYHSIPFSPAHVYFKAIYICLL